MGAGRVADGPPPEPRPDGGLVVQVGFSRSHVPSSAVGKKQRQPNAQAISYPPAHDTEIQGRCPVCSAEVIRRLRVGHVYPHVEPAEGSKLRCDFACSYNRSHYNGSTLKPRRKFPIRASALITHNVARLRRAMSRLRVVS